MLVRNVVERLADAYAMAFEVESQMYQSHQYEKLIDCAKKRRAALDELLDYVFSESHRL